MTGTFQPWHRLHHDSRQRKPQPLPLTNSPSGLRSPANMQDTLMPDASHDSPPLALFTPSIPQKRPPNPEDVESTIPARTKPPREKKESWKKKEALNSVGNSSANINGIGGGSGGGGTGSGKHTTGHNTPGGLTANTTAWPTINRWRLPPPKEQDYYGHRAPPTMVIGDIVDLPEEFVAVNDQFVPTPPTPMCNR